MAVNLKLNHKLLEFATTHKPIKCVVSGRGAGKSLGIGDILTTKMQTERVDLYCLREFMENTSDSVHRVIKGSIEDRLQLPGWDVQEKRIVSPYGNVTRYVGASRNPDSIKSAEDYRYSWFEEAQKASQSSLDLLLPTILRRPGAECFFSANPESSEDPFSKRFILKQEDQLRTTGRYEDDLHLILFISWRDNPWWDESQEKLRIWDYENLTRAKYDWIWEGAWNDTVEDSLILAEWFDSCVDAHKKLGWEPTGAKIAAHDPSDEGGDTKTYGLRHGSVLLKLEEKTTGNVNEGGDWATSHALNDVADHYTWDCDGMGVALRQQTSEAFNGKHTVVTMFKGSEGVDFPDAVFEPIEDSNITGPPIKNKDALANKRAQYYFQLRKAIYKTHLAVTKGQYFDTKDMFSIDSSVKMLSKLRAELCRMPVKPNRNGKFELYTKAEMKGKFKFNSPNLADSVMMLMCQPFKINQNIGVMPQPIRPIGRR